MGTLNFILRGLAVAFVSFIAIGVLFGIGGNTLASLDFLSVTGFIILFAVVLLEKGIAKM